MNDLDRRVAIEMTDAVWKACVATLSRHGNPQNNAVIIAAALKSAMDILGQMSPEARLAALYSFVEDEAKSMDRSTAKTALADIMARLP